MVETGDILKAVLIGPVYRLNVMRETKKREESKQLGRFKTWQEIVKMNKNHDMVSYLVEAYGWMISDLNKVVVLLSE